ncbi:hypothetical protein H4684_002626 [Desulfomicrobium macestii]|uniref:Ig-like domain-containing protein n=1 Tax=Desulfomicrobium macestii TaxID=90731 RepID=A0ABR9H5I3_9BACT|nr:hypothetical protein [Desulfomicrobium macestii]MBE1425967.1 hypothetical protein [Desulfomicrobium macestii]
MKNKALFITILTCFIMTYCHTYLHAINLKLSSNDYEQIARHHKELLNLQFLICGDSKIGSSDNYLQNFFQGHPQRGFLLTPPLINTDIKKLIRIESDNSKLINILNEKFSHLMLVSVDKNFENIMMMKNPEVEIYIPKPLHECLIDKKKMWGCGVSMNKSDECCEKKLGSPSIKAKWTDKKNGETYTLIYRLESGNSILQQTQENQKNIYFCINSESFIITK